MTELEKDYVRRIVSIEQDDRKKKLLRKEFVEFFNVSVSQISAITAWSKIWENPPSLMYENNTKRAWRQQIKNDVEKMFPEDRSNLRVLCFPGEMAIEIEEIWHPLGITNIVGVERERSRVFQHSQNRLKFQGFTGDLETLLQKKTIPTEYDIVCLDYLGPVHKGIFNCLENIKIRDNKLCLIVNVMGRRERDDIKDILEQDAIVSNCTLDQYLQQRQELNNRKGIAVLRDKTACISYYMALYDMLREAGRTHVTANDFNYFTMVLKALSGSIMDGVKRIDQAGIEGLLSLCFLSLDHDQLQTSLKNVNSYSYKSEDGGAKFYTEVLNIVKEPRGDIRNIQRLKRFLWDCVRELQSRKDDEEIYGYFSYGDKYRKTVPEIGLGLKAKNITLPFKILDLAEKEAEVFLNKCLARKYYSSTWGGTERKQIIST